MSEAFDEAMCLSFDPFGGDYGDGEVRLADRFVVGRKAHVCHWCGQPVARAERHRVITEAHEGVVEAFRFCALCCAAMATWAEDDSELEARALLHPNNTELRRMIAERAKKAPDHE